MVSDIGNDAVIDSLGMANPALIEFGVKMLAEFIFLRCAKEDRNFDVGQCAFGPEPAAGRCEEHERADPAVSRDGYGLRCPPCDLKPRGIDALSLMLGFTDTPARRRTGVPVADIPGMPILTADDVAEQALDHLADGGPVYVPPSYAQMFQYLCSTPRRQLAERMSGMGRSPPQNTI
jgi:hypothetical protein